MMLWLWGVGAASNSLAPPWGEEGRQTVKGPGRKAHTGQSASGRCTPRIVFCHLQELANSGRGGPHISKHQNTENKRHGQCNYTGIGQLQPEPGNREEGGCGKHLGLRR